MMRTGRVSAERKRLLRSADAYAKDVLRLHVPFLSGNSKEDQRIKLCVRDSVMEYIGKKRRGSRDQTGNRELEVRTPADIETIAARTREQSGELQGET